jgi:hypothetical protein
MLLRIRKPLVKPITISKTKPFTGYMLTQGQQIDIVVQRKRISYIVYNSFLYAPDNPNRAALTKLGMTDAYGDFTPEAQARIKAAGLDPEGGWWPVGPLKAQATFLRSLFSAPTAKRLES